MAKLSDEEMAKRRAKQNQSVINSYGLQRDIIKKKEKLVLCPDWVIRTESSWNEKKRRDSKPADVIPFKVNKSSFSEEP